MLRDIRAAGIAPSQKSILSVRGRCGQDRFERRAADPSGCQGCHVRVWACALWSSCKAMRERWSEDDGRGERTIQALRTAEFPVKAERSTSVPIAQRAFAYWEHSVAPASEHRAKKLSQGPRRSRSYEATRREVPGSTHLGVVARQNSAPSTERATLHLRPDLQPIKPFSLRRPMIKAKGLLTRCERSAKYD